MSNTNTGGPAFPIPLNQGQSWQGMGPCDGMTLRDYFAAKMLNGMVASPELLEVVTAAEVLGDEYSQRCANIAYKWADAMLKARGE